MATAKAGRLKMSLKATKKMVLLSLKFGLMVLGEASIKHHPPKNNLPTLEFLSKLLPSSARATIPETKT